MEDSPILTEPQKKYSILELSHLVNAKIQGNVNISIDNVNSLEDAKNTDISFLGNPKYFDAMKKSNAGCICVDDKTQLSDHQNYLICQNPSLAFQKILELFKGTKTISAFSGVHPSAIIHPSAKIHSTACIGPYCVIDANCSIGANTHLVSHVYIGFGSQIGENCTLHASSVVREQCILRNNVTLQPGAIIGSCGFGYTLDSQGQYQKLEQVGNVILENNVDIGANTVVDRARFKTTIIKKGSKIDNLCQIAHNVEVGEHNVIAAQTGIAGSSKTGKYVMLGGQVGIVGHVVLDDKVMVATRGGVSKSLKSGTYRGSPAIPIQDYNRQEVYIRKIESLSEKIKKLEELINETVKNNS